MMMCKHITNKKAPHRPPDAARKAASGRRNDWHGPTRRQTGQAMIEYMVVLAFGVIVLIKPFSYNDVSNPNATADQAPALQQVAQAVRDYHQHYTYALSIAYIPDCDYTYALDKSVSAADIASLTGNAAISTDRCINWSNPQIPGVSVSGALSFVLPTSPSAVTSAIGDMITQSISSSISGFLDPSSLLSGMFNFSPSDFF